jgi:hypothetical protein
LLPSAASGFSSVTTAKPLRDGTYIMPVSGSTAAPDQFAPPTVPGRIMVPCRDGGVKSGPILNSFTASSAVWRSSGVKSTRSSIVTPWYSNGAGFVGTGCVGEARSPGTSDGGTGCSSIGQTG